MTQPIEASLDRLMSGYGPMNFQLDCAVGGVPARITMNETRVFLAVTESTGYVRSAHFAHAEVSGASPLARTLTLNGMPAQIVFAAADDAAHLVRVLAARQETAAAGARGAGGASNGGEYPPPADRQLLSERWAGYALAASTVVLVLAWLNLAAGAITAFVLMANGRVALGLAWLLAAGTGCAVPLCLACLTRAIIYRSRVASE